MIQHASGGLIRPHSSRLGLLHRLADVAIILFMLWLCSYLYGVGSHYYHELAAAWAIVFFLFFAEVRGLYQSWRINSLRSEMALILWVWFAVICSVIIFAFLTKISEQFSRVVIVAWSMAAPAGLIVLRVSVRTWLRFLRREGRNSRTLAFAGAGELANKMASKMAAAPWMGLAIAGVYDDRESAPLWDGLPFKGDLAQLIDDVRGGLLDYVYITLPLQDEAKTLSLLNELADTTASVYVVPDMYIHNLLHARWFSMEGIPVARVFESPFYGVDGWLKRFEDIVIGGAILLCISPVMLLIALAVKLTSPGPAIFRQRRYGLNGEVIEVWKFRSMRVCENGPDVSQAKRCDPRITPLGAFLRKTSLDELPQFVNVLQGQMSIVGPRPHAVAHNEQYRKLIYGYMLRHKVKPGITGWAQINGWRGETDTLDKMEKRVEHDLFYIHNWTLSLDTKIIAMTILKGFSGKNAY
ncbi:MAG: undecaprenyl-phosphate glucose phosphotransferase [Sulfuricella sp.]|nr:undecaprenyl-phosphate glucose phosphotransferase [Sulfuricella sp.]